MSSGENHAHERMETAATMVDYQDYFSKEPKVSPSSSKRQEEPALQVSDAIPPNHVSRTLVVCFDGTGNKFDEYNSNVVEFFGLLKRDDNSKQMVYYQPGIGTYNSPRYSTSRIGSKMSKLSDEAFAWNLKAHVTGGYEFLMQNYRPSKGHPPLDTICIFGFSRGSYTALCLAGMLQKVGLLPAFNHQQIPFAYKTYQSDKMEGGTQCSEFKRKFGNEVKIEFLGLWDTVNSVGLTPRRLPLTQSPAVKTYRHAVSLDEHRAKFKSVHWYALNQSRPKMAKDLEDEKGEEGKEIETDHDEVWFAGCHCDIGGGSVKNSVKTSLARIPLRWMIRECFKKDSGILFLVDQLKTVNLDPNALYPKVKRRPEALSPTALTPEERHIKPGPFAWFFGAPFTNLCSSEAGEADNHHEGPFDSEELADLKDSLAPIYDELKLNWLWWIPEILPFRQRYQEVDNKKWQLFPARKTNLGYGRNIPGKEGRPMRVHRSVKTRMEASFRNGEKYTPRVLNFKEELDSGRVDWVD